jgi:DNA-binding NtrC family response regulator
MNSSIGRLLIADDDIALLGRLKPRFQRKGFAVDLTSDWASARKRLASSTYDGLLLDLEFGAENSLELLPWLVSSFRFMKIVIISGQASIDDAVQSMSLGAARFISKQRSEESLVEESSKWLSSTPTIASAHKMGEIDLIGHSSAFREVTEEIKKVCDVSATVLLTGASGTGKELFARFIHQSSKRRDHLFEAINCGAIPENLLESELFGHVKGAFTDAKSDRKGLFEVCSEGTLFLDEIGEMPLHLQVKLLRVLQEKEIRPVGSNVSVKVFTRVLCATNKDLEAEVHAGRFREDLYFRLSVFPIELPSLCERMEDIPDLISGFVAHFNQLYDKNVQFPDEFEFSKILSYSWPGNIRQLKNAIERGVVLANDTRLLFENMLPRNRKRVESSETRFDEPFFDNYYEAKEHFEKQFLERLLKKTRGNVSEAARISGRFRSDIYRLLEKYELKRSAYSKIS